MQQAALDPRSQRLEPHHKRVGFIHQPYFLPWLGYFQRLACSDVFVVMDSVAFSKGHYLDRTRIIDMHGGVRWLSLPTGQGYGLAIDEVRLHPPDPKTLAHLIRTLEHSYASAREHAAEWPFVQAMLLEALASPSGALSAINMSLICAIARRVQTRLPSIVSLRSLELPSAMNPTTRLVEICRLLGITHLVVGAGKSSMVHSFGALRASGVRVMIHDFLSRHPAYLQARRGGTPFVPGLSIVDALMNLGSAGVHQLLHGQASAQWLTLSEST